MANRPQTRVPVRNNPSPFTPGRTHANCTIEELEDIFRLHGDHAQVLGDLRVELEYRQSARAKRLRKAVVAVVNGEVAPPTPPEKPWPTVQGELL